MKKYKKIVLAYSGGLDTTAIIPWLKEKFDYPAPTLYGMEEFDKMIEEQKHNATLPTA